MVMVGEETKAGAISAATQVRGNSGLHITSIGILLQLVYRILRLLAAKFCMIPIVGLRGGAETNFISSPRARARALETIATSNNQ